MNWVSIVTVSFRTEKASNTEGVSVWWRQHGVYTWKSNGNSQVCHSLLKIWSLVVVIHFVGACRHIVEHTRIKCYWIVVPNIFSHLSKRKHCYSYVWNSINTSFGNRNLMDEGKHFRNDLWIIHHSMAKQLSMGIDFLAFYFKQSFQCMDNLCLSWLHTLPVVNSR